jgi:hypothetical protein
VTLILECEETAAKTNTGVLRFAQDDDVKQATATTARARATATANAGILRFAQG